ncbi:MAG TPA: hypothetical protein VFR59_02860, partial [Steroidobacteraceae bacterium]|nr:hypothetical protein [Steroidobacteraceae bacterium]
RITALVHARSPRLPPSTAFVLGRLAERHENEALRARERVEPAWRKVRGKRWKKLRGAMKETRKAVAPANAEASAPATSSAPQRS